MAVAVEPGDVVLFVDRVNDLHRFGERPHLARRVVVREDDLLSQVASSDVREEVLQRLGVVGEVQAFVAQAREDHLDHERLEAEAGVFPLQVPHPELDQPNDLHKVLRLRLLALLREI